MKLPPVPDFSGPEKTREELIVEALAALGFDEERDADAYRRAHGILKDMLEEDQ